MRSLMTRVSILLLLSAASICDCSSYIKYFNATEIVRLNESYWLNCSYYSDPNWEHTGILTFLVNDTEFYHYSNDSKQGVVTPVSGIDESQVEPLDINQGQIRINKARNESEGTYKCALSVLINQNWFNTTSNEAYVRVNFTSDDDGGHDDDNDNNTAAQRVSVNYYICLVLVSLIYFSAT